MYAQCTLRAVESGQGGIVRKRAISGGSQLVVHISWRTHTQLKVTSRSRSNWTLSRARFRPPPLLPAFTLEMASCEYICTRVRQPPAVEESTGAAGPPPAADPAAEDDDDEYSGGLC